MSLKKISFGRFLFFRLVKKVQIYGRKNLLLEATSELNKFSILNARHGSIKLGNQIRIGNFTELVSSSGNEIQIKDHASIYSNCRIIGSVVIERYGLLTTNIYMSSGNHAAFIYPELLIKQQDKLIRNHPDYKSDFNKPIHIHEDVWIGNGVFIGAGVTIGRGAIIGAGSIVTHDVAPYAVLVGTPARQVKSRLSFVPPSSLSCQNRSDFPYFYQGFDHFEEEENINKEGFLIIDDSILCLAKTSAEITLKGTCTQNNVSFNLSSGTNQKQFLLESGDFELTFAFPENHDGKLYLSADRLKVVRLKTINV